MIFRCVVCGFVAVLAAGCGGLRSDGTLARINDRLDRMERTRRVTTALSMQRDSSNAVCRLASYSNCGSGDRLESRSHTPVSMEVAYSLALIDTPADDEAGAMTATTARKLVDSSARPEPLPGLWDTIKRDVKAMPGDLWRDTKKVYTSVPNLLILGVSYGGALAVQDTGPDNTVEDDLRGHDIFSDGVNETFGALGNPATHFAVAGAWYLIGQQTQDDKTYSVGKKLFSALIINSVSTMLGQAAAWDDGPNGEWGAFPSGHTSSTFCFASVMHEEYGALIGFPLYGLGALVAIERLDDDEHYFSDVLMGAVLGMVVGHTVAGERELELLGGRVLPYADPYTGSTGVAWVKEFK